MWVNIRLTHPEKGASLHRTLIVPGVTRQHALPTLAAVSWVHQGKLRCRLWQ
jgi:hypothetical protein